MTCHICPSSPILFCRGIGSSNPLAVAVATAKKNLGGNEQLALAVYENHYREGWALWDLRKDYDLQAAVVCELFNSPKQQASTYLISRCHYSRGHNSSLHDYSRKPAPAHVLYTIYAYSY